jgi:hypothetical protein
VSLVPPAIVAQSFDDTVADHALFQWHGTPQFCLQLDVATTAAGVAQDTGTSGADLLDAMSDIINPSPRVW